MRLTEFRAALPCQPSQAISVYLYCVNRYIIEHLTQVDISMTTTTGGGVRLRRAYRLASSSLPSWAQFLIPNGVQALEVCDVDVGNGHLVSTISCPVLDDRLSLRLESRFQTAPSLPNVFGLSRRDLARRKLVDVVAAPAPTFVYKLARLRFRQFGLQAKIEDYFESMIVDVTQRIFARIADWHDQWQAFADASLGAHILYRRPSGGAGPLRSRL